MEDTNEVEPMAEEKQRLREIVDKFVAAQRAYADAREAAAAADRAKQAAYASVVKLRRDRANSIVKLAPVMTVTSLAAITGLQHPEVSRILSNAPMPPPRRSRNRRR